MAQNFEFSTSLGHQLFNKKIMKNSTNSNSWSFEAAYFPRFNLPVGVVVSYGLDVPDNFSSFYPSDKQPSNPTLFDNEYENKIEIKSRTSKYLVGLKLSNQENRSLINPYFLVSIGLGVSKSVFKEFEFVYWQQETVDDQGNVRYDENGDPQYETESTRTTLTKQRVTDRLKLIYSYETGFEFSPLHDSYFALKIW